MAAAAEKLDVDREQVGQVYSKALLAATEPNGTSETVVAELRSLVDVVTTQPSFAAFLASPRIPADQKVASLERVLQGRVSAELLTFLKVLATRSRLDALREIASAAHQQLNVLRGRVAVTVESAAPLDPTQLRSVEAQLTKAIGKPLDLTTRVDDSLIGGLVVRVGDTVYDGSVANQLTRLRSKALERTYSELQHSLERFEQS